MLFRNRAADTGGPVRLCEAVQIFPEHARFLFT